MAAPEQFIDSPGFQPANRDANFDELYEPSNYAAFISALKLDRQQPETGTKNDQYACFLNMEQKERFGEFTVSENNALKYTVKDGDNLWNIVNEALAKKNGEQPAAWKTLETLRKIAEKNQMKNPDLIHAGDVIDFSAIADDESTGKPESQQARPLRNTGTGEPIIANNAEEAGTDEPAKPETSPAKPSPTPERDRWYISQAGDGAYWYTCGATSLTMALAANGLMEATEANRLKLVRETGTNREVGFPGTSAKMADEARKRGLQAEAFDTQDWRAVDAQLSQGKQAIVNGTMVGRNGSLIKHFVYISGKDSAGNYILGDPASAGTTTWSKDDLAGFLTRGGAPNGFTAIWR